jgi:hypothetical protein
MEDLKLHAAQTHPDMELVPEAARQIKNLVRTA